MGKASEFMIRSGSVTVVIVQPYAPSFAALIQRMEKQGELIQVAECETSLEAVSVAKRAESCLLLCSVQSMEDANKHLSMLKLLQSEINRKRIRCLVTTSVHNGAAMQKLTIHGASEILQEPTQERSLYFKIERHVRNLARQAGSRPSRLSEAQEAATAQREGAEESEPAVPRQQARAMSRGRIVPVDPLTLESDCWLASRDLARRIGGKWVIRLIGPPPESGRWNELRTEDSDDIHWVWTPLDPETDPFIKEQGAWVFRGQRPEYQGESWHFIGKNPELAFYFEGESYGAKVASTPEGDVQIAKDSVAARNAYTLIQEAQEGAFKKKLSETASSRSGATRAAESEEIAENGFAQMAGARESRDEGRAPDLDDESPEHSGDLELKSSAPQGRGSREAKIETVAPLELESDFWILDKKRPIRVAGRWSVKLVGPGPAAGRWTEVETEGDGPQYWQWVPTDPEKDPFVKEQGAWVFRGSIPRYDVDRWIFVSEQPELSFYYEGESYGTKFKCSEDGMTLYVAEDSVIAQGFIPEIRASFVKVIRKGEIEKTEAAPQDFVVIKESDSTEQSDSDFDELIVTENEAFDQGGGEVRADWSGGSDGEPRGGVRAEDDDLHWSQGGDVRAEAESAEDSAYVRIKAEDDFTLHEHLYDEEHFGTRGGSWQYVCPRTEGGKWYVFIPLEIKNHVVEDVKSLPRYWTYWGAIKPDLILVETAELEDGTLRKWSFRARRPERCDSFDALPKKIQQFLADQDLQPGVIRDQDYHVEAEPEGTELDGHFTEERRESRELSVTLDRDPEGRELSITLDEDPIRGDLVLDNRDNPPEKLRESQDFFDDSKRRRKHGEGAANEEPASEMDLHRREEEVLVKEHKSPASARVVSPRPEGALLSPIAMAFLMSELMMKRDADLKALSQRFCTYLSASCQGARVEFWKPDSTTCVATHDGSPGELMSRAKGVIRAPIRLKDGDSAELAIVLVLPEEGSVVSPDYVSSAAGMARGLAKAIAA